MANQLFRVRLNNGEEITAHVSQQMRITYVRLVPGDIVMVEMSPFNNERARITSKVHR